MALYLQVFLPLAMFLMMFVIGTELAVADFRRVMQFPGLISAATAGQLLGLPMLAVLLVFLLEPSTALLIGLIITAAAPGGGLSNVISARAGANVALSISLTAVSSLACLLTMPLVFGFLFSFLSMEQSGFDLPVVPIMAQLVVLLLVPVVSGMFIRHRFEQALERQRRKLNLFNSVLLIAVIAYSLTLDEGLDGEAFIAALPLAVAFLALCWFTGAALSHAFALSKPDKRAVCIEFMLRSGAVPSMVIASVFRQVEWLAFPAAYVSLQLVFSLLLVSVSRSAGSSD